MITEFKNNIFSLENICGSILMFFAYSLLFRNPLIKLLNAEDAICFNFKKIFEIMFGGSNVLIAISISVALIVFLKKDKNTKDIIFHNHGKVKIIKINFEFLDKEYDSYLFNSLNPFLLGCKTMELRE